MSVNIFVLIYFSYYYYYDYYLLLKCRSHVRAEDKGVVATAVLKWGNVAGAPCAAVVVSGVFVDVAGSPDDE